MDEQSFYHEAFARNIGLLTREQQDQLRQSTVAIAGLGGGGGIHAYTMARLGVGNFHITDLDVFDIINTNRQAGATAENMGKPKTEGIKNLILSINPHAKVTVFDEGINPTNIDNFLDGVDVVLDGIDFFNIDTRRLLMAKSHAKGIYAITAGPIGFGSSVVVFGPHGASFDEYMDIYDGMPKIAMLVRFGLGLTPTIIQRSYFQPSAVNWKEELAPSLVIGTTLAASLAGTEAVKILTGQLSKVKVAPYSMQFDPYLRKLKKVWIPWGNKNPIQRLKLWIVTWIMRSRGNI